MQFARRAANEANQTTKEKKAQVKNKRTLLLLIAGRAYENWLQVFRRYLKAMSFVSAGYC